MLSANGKASDDASLSCGAVILVAHEYSHHRLVGQPFCLPIDGAELVEALHDTRKA